MSKPLPREISNSEQKKTFFNLAHGQSAYWPIIEALFENAFEAIALLDVQGCLVEVNGAMGQMLGIPRHRLIGTMFSRFLETDTDGWPGEIQATEPQVGELTLAPPRREPFQLRYQLIPTVIPDCHLLRLSAVNLPEETFEAQLQQQQQRMELFSEVTLKIRQTLQLPEILHTTVTEVQRILKADRVLIYRVYPDGTGQAISEAVAPPYPAILDTQFPEEVFPEEYKHLYAQGRVRAIADVHDPEAGLAECLVEFVDRYEVKAKLIVPIVHNLNLHSQIPSRGQNQLWGLLIAHQCNQARHWVESELELMQQLADQIGIALAQAQLLEHQEELVEARTVELIEVNHNLEQEISERLQAESALRQSEEQLQLITHALPVLIAYVDAQQHYRFNNKAYEDWLGKSSSEIGGRHLRKIWGKDCYQRMYPYVKAALSGQTISYENEIILADGRVRTVDVTYIPDIETPGIVKGFFALTSDISDHKAIERMKDEFISVVSHELRTPLTSLHSALKILATGQLGVLSQDGQQILTIASDSTDRLVRLVNNVLDLQRIESGKVILERRSCDVASLMLQATEAMQAMAQQHGITLVNESKNIEVWVNPDYILQALTNLLSNAIKFSAPEGTVWLSVERAESPQYPRHSATPDHSTPGYGTKGREFSTPSYLPEEGPLFNPGPKNTGSEVKQAFSAYAVFRIRDEGQGIPANHLKQIFEKFHQVDSSDSRKKGGTGLGLTICRKIIEQHNGEIWVESSLGCGSTFLFTLPIFKTQKSNHDNTKTDSHH